MHLPAARVTPRIRRGQAAAHLKVRRVEHHHVSLGQTARAQVLLQQRDADVQAVGGAVAAHALCQLRLPLHAGEAPGPPRCQQHEADDATAGA